MSPNLVVINQSGDILHKNICPEVVPEPRLTMMYRTIYVTSLRTLSVVKGTGTRLWYCTTFNDITLLYVTLPYDGVKTWLLYNINYDYTGQMNLWFILIILKNNKFWNYTQNCNLVSITKIFTSNYIIHLALKRWNHLQVQVWPPALAIMVAPRVKARIGT